MLFHDRRSQAFSVSLVVHLACFVALGLAMRQGARTSDLVEKPCLCIATPLVWLADRGPGGGGGGGGNHKKEPPRRAELPGHDAVTVPAAKPRVVDPSKPITPETAPIPSLLIPVATLASSNETLPGSMTAPPGLSASQGPGDGGGAGTGRGTGDGPGRGPGLGDGQGGNTGGDVYQPGNGVTLPVEIRKGVPRYTSDAMRARVQGAITVQCVVQPSGECDRIRVLRSTFNPSFGLDDEAVKAAAQWRFRPGTRRGQPVAVLVTMEIAFTLR